MQLESEIQNSAPTKPKAGQSFAAPTLLAVSYGGGTNSTALIGAEDGAVRLQGLVRKPRHKWFAHAHREAENGWIGPHDHIEDAARAALLAWEAEGDTCYIAQGRKLTNAEYEEHGAEYTWEVDTLNAMKLVLPNDPSSATASAARLRGEASP
jgi:hypothetical protein